jgi:hypothetical protein
MARRRRSPPAALIPARPPADTGKTTAGPAGPAAISLPRPLLDDGLDVRRLKALGALDDLELDALALAK